MSGVAMPARAVPRAPLRTWLRLAAWGALGFGLLEGLVLAATRIDPRILAPGKVPNAVVVVAPLVNLPFFLLAAIIGWAAWRHAPAAWRRVPDEGVALRFVVLLGALSVLASPDLIAPVAAGILAAGSAVAAGRAAAGREGRLLAWVRPRWWVLPVAIAAAGAAAAGYAVTRERLAAARLPAPPDDGLNVLVLMLDTVRRDRFTADRAPNLARLAAGGVRFENAWSTTSWSLPSQASLLTGAYPAEHGADFPGIALDPNVPMISEYLARRGYATGAFSSNANWITPEHLGRGFLRFEAYRAQEIALRTTAGRVLRAGLDRLGYHHAGFGKPAPELSAEFLDFVDDYADRPFFAYLCYMDVNRDMHRRALGHPAWAPPPSRLDVVATYDSALTALDAHVGALLRELAQRGRLDSTLIIVTSDHGESFGEGTLGDHDPAGHATSLYPEQTQVPLFVVMPGRVPRVASEVVTIRSIPATIADALGDPGSPFAGPSLFTAGDDSAFVGLATLNYRDRTERSVFWGGWQYISAPAARGEELFDLDADPLATRNLATQAPAALAHARRQLNALEHAGQAVTARRADGNRAANR